MFADGEGQRNAEKFNFFGTGKWNFMGEKKIKFVYLADIFFASPSPLEEISAKIVSVY